MITDAMANGVVVLVQDGVDVALRVRFEPDDSGSLVVKNLGRAHKGSAWRSCRTTFAATRTIA